MTDKTFTFTIEQIKEIYDAGYRRGADEQCAYEWGSRASGKYYDNCEEVIHEIVNKGFKWGDVGYIHYTDVEDWFKEAK